MVTFSHDRLNMADKIGLRLSNWCLRRRFVYMQKDRVLIVSAGILDESKIIPRVKALGNPCKCFAKNIATVFAVFLNYRVN